MRNISAFSTNAPDDSSVHEASSTQEDEQFSIYFFASFYYKIHLISTSFGQVNPMGWTTRGWLRIRRFFTRPALGTVSSGTGAGWPCGTRGCTHDQPYENLQYFMSELILNKFHFTLIYLLYAYKLVLIYCILDMW